MIIDAANLYYKELNEKIRPLKGEITLKNVLGQRYIGNSTEEKTITIEGISGNALGSYMNGSKIICQGNAQDAVGDTMNKGEIVIHGYCGDALGYGMRGGEIYVKGNTGYRTGIHMKEYKENKPVVVVGGKAGDFLGEYQAGGYIIVLGLGANDFPVGNYLATGMHGGKMFIRSTALIKKIPNNINVTKATNEDLGEISPYINKFCKYFGVEEKEIFSTDFYILTPSTKNPYDSLYTAH